MKNNYLKTYEVRLTALSPVFIGNGKSISKKEYMLLGNEGKAYIMDQEKLYFAMAKMGKTIPFENYLLDLKAKNLFGWFLENRIDYHNLTSAIKYKVDCGDRFITDKGKIEIMEFMKDPYNSPFIPGSSLKGMIRTILLANEIMHNSELKKESCSSISSALLKEKNSRRILNREVSSVENSAFRTLDRGANQENPRNKVKKSDAVNDVLQGLIVSDSEPLSTDNLVLCQKIDKHIDGHEKPLNILRECLKPGTEIVFSLTIDTTVCKLTIEEIMNAIMNFNEQYFENFSSAFGVDRPLNDVVYLGGGAGFVSKTIIYPLFPGDEGVTKTVSVFDKTMVPFVHKHRDDRRKGVSPHTIKCTRYKGKLYEMGKCSFKMTEVNI